MRDVIPVIIPLIVSRPCMPDLRMSETGTLLMPLRPQPPKNYALGGGTDRPVARRVWRYRPGSCKAHIVRAPCGVLDLLALMHHSAAGTALEDYCGDIEVWLEVLAIEAVRWPDAPDRGVLVPNVSAHGGDWVWQIDVRRVAEPAAVSRGSGRS